jgi:hypothetical protein
MPSQKHLNGIAHDIAHHAQSGLSCLHPYLGQLCRLAKEGQATVELTAPEPYPDGLGDHQPLRLALGALRQKLIDLLAQKSLAMSYISSFVLEFTFSADRTDDYSSEVRAKLVTRAGRTFMHTLH